jgi:two-component system chemotaxis response regulator CheB
MNTGPVDLPPKHPRPIRVLVVDDSPSARKALHYGLSQSPDIHVVGTASDAISAKDKILMLRPDLITLDVEMPGKDGITFLREIMRENPLPVIIVSSQTPRHSQRAIEALMAGAMEVVPKPPPSPKALEELTATLIRKIKIMAGCAPRLLKKSTSSFVTNQIATQSIHTHKINPTVSEVEGLIAIGASAGGTEAIKELLSQWPARMPPILIIQHLPPQFTEAFARALDEICGLKVEEAVNGRRLEPGLALVAKGDHHMVLSTDGKNYLVNLKKGPKVHFQRPSVDVLFNSIARFRELKAIGILLTGMGVDGAKGLLAMRNAGALTIAQDMESSVIYGMPREAARIRAAQLILPLEMIGINTLSFVREYIFKQKNHPPLIFSQKLPINR